MKRCMLLLAALPLVSLAGEETVTRGDTLIVEEMQGESQPRRTREATRPVPVRGQAMANVRNVFGEPPQEHAPVGDPPITRWDYDGYSVFFEYDKVLHTVITE